MSPKKEFNNSVAVENNYGSITNNITSKVVQRTEVVYDPDLHISPEQAAKIQQMVSDLVSMLAAKSTETRAKLFREVYTQLNKKFKAPMYRLIPKDSFDDAVIWLRKYKGGAGRKTLKKHAPERWVVETCKSIYSKAGELGIEHDSVLRIASQILQKPGSVSSLKELSKKELEQVYLYFFSGKK